MAVPSFNKLSPSNNVLNLKGVPRSFNKATTATGSVEHIILDNVKTADHENSFP